MGRMGHFGQVRQEVLNDQFNIMTVLCLSIAYLNLRPIWSGHASQRFDNALASPFT